MTSSTPQLRIALLLGAAATLATLALFPYVLALQPHASDKLPLAPAIVIAAQTAQSGVLCFLLAWAGLKLGAPLGLGAPWLTARMYADRAKPASSNWLAATGLGVLGALLVLGIIALFGPPLAEAAAHVKPPTTAPWRGALASFYGGIVEEIQLRLFLLTLIAWLLTRARLRQPWAFGIAIAAAALLFGAGHLPMAAKLAPLDAATVARVVGYNALLGLAFGWLYCRHGLEHAMLAHFSADLVLHVVAPLAHSL
ncbi:MAG: CPBP family glutamic-type intramembrane protease [Rudaea sp.]|uniref:CPBP family glutamic-type intramembrane protease n=1 Tax=Rudaea sp. TaxID=2136325 RepID=UPI0039E3AD43